MLSAVHTSLRTFGAALFIPARLPKTLVLFVGVTLAFVGAYLGGFFTESQVLDLRNWALLPGVPLLALALSDLPLKEPHRQKTLLYLVVSPVGRSVLATVRTLGCALLVMGGLCLIVLGLSLCTQRWSPLIATQLGAIAVGSVFYMCFFGLFQLLFRRGIFAGVLFYFLLDIPLARLPAELCMLAPSWHVRVLGGSFFLRELPRVEGLEPSPIISVFCLLIGALTCWALTLAVFSRKDLGDLC